MGDPGLKETLGAVHKQFLTDIGAAGRTVKIPVNGNVKHSLQVLGVGTATVHLERSNKPGPDLNTDADWESLENVSADGFIDALGKPALWMTVNVSAWTAGTINAHLVSTP